jgi:gas vesicle protein
MRNTEKNYTNGACTSAVPFFLTGLGTGVALAMLFAPQSGYATRGLIGRKYKESSEKVKDTASAAAVYAASKATDIRDRAKDVSDAITQS